MHFLRHVLGLLVVVGVVPPAYATPPEVAANASSWPLPNKNYANSRADFTSPISAKTLRYLNVDWSYVLESGASDEFGAATSNPLILDDTVYFQDRQSNLHAVDLATGIARWERHINQPNFGPNGVAVGWGKVFAPVSDQLMMAFDAQSGADLWSVNLGRNPGEGITIQPLAYDNTVYMSTVPVSNAGGYVGGTTGMIHALNPDTGASKWSFDTVDSPDIWGNPEVNSGGGAWYSPAIDTDRGVTYWGTGNPEPWSGTPNFPNGSSRPGDNRYTNSLVALNHVTGELEWHNQVRPHDLFDHDFQIPPILASIPTDGGQRDIVIGSGKMGVVFAFDRDTGETLWETPVGKHQNDDLTSIPSGQRVEVFPGMLGGMLTPMAYADGLVFVPSLNLASSFSDVDHITDFSYATATGDFTAIDAATGRVVWSREFDTLMVGAATVVNDLVFTATYKGTILALDRETGEELWSYDARNRINAWPAVSGDTIVFPVGFGSRSGPPQLLAFSVPEPSAGVLAIVSLLACCLGVCRAIHCPFRSFRRTPCFLIAVAGLTVTVAIAHAQPTFGPCVPLDEINSPDSGEFSPSLSPDGLELFFMGYERSGGFGDSDIYVAKRPDLYSPFGEPVNLGPVINAHGPDSNPELSGDGLTLYFDAERPGGYGDRDIWMTTRTNLDAPWGIPVNAGSGVNTSGWEGRPTVTEHGLAIVFDRHHERHLNTLQMATRASTAESFANRYDIGIVTADAEFTPDGLALYFPGFIDGQVDLFYAQRHSADAPFGAPVHVEGPVNSPDFTEIDPGFSLDGRELFLVRTTVDVFSDGFLDEADLCVAYVNPLSGDTNHDAIVDIVDLNNVRNNYGSAGLGDTNNDGTIDLVDLNNVRNFFGTTSPQAVPEPSSFYLLFLGAVMLGSVSCRRCQPKCWCVVMLCFTLLWWPQAARAGQITEMFVFGDSHSDVGNWTNVGRFSNGPVWVEELAATLQLPHLTAGFVASRSHPEGGNDYAYGGARTGDGIDTFPEGQVPRLGAQLDRYLQFHEPTPSTLFVFFAGHNDFCYYEQPDESVVIANLLGNISRLAGAGAEQFLVVSQIHPLGHLPGYRGTSREGPLNAISARFNAEFPQALEQLEVDLGVNIHQFDLATLFNDVIADPAAFGFTNVTDMAQGRPGIDPDEYVYWDTDHFTTAFHRLFGERAAQAVPEPGGIAIAVIGIASAMSCARFGRGHRPRLQTEVAAGDAA